MVFIRGRDTTSRGQPLRISNQQSGYTGYTNSTIIEELPSNQPTSSVQLTNRTLVNIPSNINRPRPVNNVELNIQRQRSEALQREQNIKNTRRQLTGSLLLTNIQRNNTTSVAPSQRPPVNTGYGVGLLHTRTANEITSNEQMARRAARFGPTTRGGARRKSTRKNRKQTRRQRKPTTRRR
jgi:hypothetical protein